jgi:serine/threonine-protein kinase
LLLLLVGAVAQALYFYPKMPGRMAVHFDLGGAPNGWMTRPVALGLHAGLVGLILIAFLGLPRLLPRMPRGLINLPNRAYWLAPSRRTETLRDLEGRLAWFGAAALLTRVLVQQLVFQASLTPAPRLPDAPFLAILGGFLAFTAGWLVRLCRRFPREAP